MNLYCQTMTRADYLNLKLKLFEEFSTNANTEMLLEKLKDIFDADINSIRKREQIKGIADLVKVLERRNCLAGDDIGPLKTMSHFLNRNGNMSRLIDKYEDNLHIYGYNEQESYIGQLHANMYSSNVPNETSHGLEISQRKKYLIYDTIANEIGKFWRDFARNLKIREGDIDSMEKKFNNDVKAKIYHILEIFEHKSDLNKWQYSICKALEDARRKDLRKEVELILIMNK